MFYLNIHRYTHYIVVSFHIPPTNHSVLFHTIIFNSVPSEIHYDSEEKFIPPPHKPPHVYAEVARRVIDEHILVN